MKIDASFIRRLAIASVAIAVVGGLSFREALADGSVMVAAVVGYAIALVNVIVGYAAVRRARGGDMRRFNIVLFGSMTVRVVGILAVLTICVLVVKLHAIALVTSLFSFYIVFLVIELQALLAGARHPSSPGSSNG